MHNKTVHLRNQSRPDLDLVVLIFSSLLAALPIMDRLLGEG